MNYQCPQCGFEMSDYDLTHDDWRKEVKKQFPSIDECCLYTISCCDGIDLLSNHKKWIALQSNIPVITSCISSVGGGYEFNLCVSKKVYKKWQNDFPDKFQQLIAFDQLHEIKNQ